MFSFCKLWGCVMSGYRGEFLFGDGNPPLSQIFLDRQQEMVAQIEREKESYLAQVNEQDYVAHITSQFSFLVPQFDFESMTVDQEERMIAAERFPRGYSVFSGKSYPKPVVIYQIPFVGDDRLLRARPSTRPSWQPQVYVRNGHVCFNIIAWNPDDPAPIKRTAENNINAMRQIAAIIVRDVSGFNSGLEHAATQAVQYRKQRFMQRSNLLASLGVPVIRREDVPETFAVPTRREPQAITFPKPEVRDSQFRPEPALDASTYREILKVIQDAGKVRERLPSTYRDKGEEDLRDHLIMMLTPHFSIEGSVTGETFNKIGKTDILIRWQNHNVFVAECKFWGGEKKYFETIDQLLGYLTWRDSKTAVILFDRNKDISASLAVIETNTANHPNYLGVVGKSQEGWFNYRFHIKDDRNREFQMAVLVFHLPPIL